MVKYGKIWQMGLVFNISNVISTPITDPWDDCIFAYMNGFCMANVGTYASPMDGMGIMGASEKKRVFISWESKGQISPTPFCHVLHTPKQIRPS